MEESEIKKYLGQVFYFLSFRSRSEKELVTYLSQKNLNAEGVATVMGRVRELGLIDDGNFCRQVIESKMKRAYGPKKIYFDLLNKGISSADAKVALAQIDQSKWVDSIHSFIVKKYPGFEFFQNPKVKIQLTNSLYSRGYNSQTVKNAIDALGQKE